MEEFVKSLSSVGWWTSVVAVGLVLNVASNYLFRWIDKAGVSFSSRLSARSAKRIERFDHEVTRLTLQPGLAPYYFQMETRLRFQAIQFLIFALLFAIFPLLFAALLAEVEPVAQKNVLRVAFPFLILASGLSALMSHRSLLGAMRTRSILNKSRIALGIL